MIESGLRVVVLVSFYDDKKLLEEFSLKNLVFEPLPYPKKIRWELFFLEMFRGVIFNKTIRTYYKYKFLTYEPNYLLYYPRAIFYSIIQIVPGIKHFLRFLDSFLNPQCDNDHLFKKYNPSLVFSSTPHDRGDIGIIKSARRFGVKVTGMPKSWDNLSKTLFPAKLDKFFVWSAYMKDEAVRFQGYKAKDVEVVGIPQFDFYRNKDWLLTREEYCRQMGLNINKKIILYASTGAAFDENGYLELIHDSMSKNVLRDVQVLMRPHVGYKGEMKKFEPLLKYPDFFIDRSDIQSSKLKDNWDTSLGHVKNLYNSLYHADICVNVASTMTLDATACGTPVVNVCFDIENVHYKKSIARVYETDYFGSVVSFNGTWVARNKEEFLDFVKKTLVNKDGKQEERKRLSEYFMYKIDGNSSERLVNGIIKLLN